MKDTYLSYALNLDVAQLYEHNIIGCHALWLTIERVQCSAVSNKTIFQELHIKLVYYGRGLEMIRINKSVSEIEVLHISSIFLEPKLRIPLVDILQTCSSKFYSVSISVKDVGVEKEMT